MNKKLLIIPIAVVVLIVSFLGTQSNNEIEKEVSPFHVTLANPSQYQNGIYSSKSFLDKGDHSFTFVPNGDSPKNLDIEIKGENFEFSENFKLKGTLHETGISEYYTWDYDGVKSFQIDSTKEIAIQINPNGNILGSVSVDIIRN